MKENNMNTEKKFQVLEYLQEHLSDKELLESLVDILSENEALDAFLFIKQTHAIDFPEEE